MTVQSSPGDCSGALTRAGLALDHRKRLARLRRHDRRHAALEDAGLLGGDLLERIAEELDVIERDRRDHGRERTVDHVGGVEPPAQADLEQQHVGRMTSEQQKRRRGGDLEHRDRRAGVGALAFVERVARARRRRRARPSPARRAGSAR